MSGASAVGGPLPRGAAPAAYGTFVAFVLIGLVMRLAGHAPVDGAADAAAATVALGAGWLVFFGPPRLWSVSGAVATAGVAVIGNGTASNLSWFALAVVAGWLVLAVGRHEGVIYGTAAVAVLGVEWARVRSDPGWGAWTAGTAFTVLGALIVGHEHDLVARLRAAQAGLAEQSKIEERTRIARELHDVIAHTLTVSLLHVSGARVAIEHDPDDAVRALAEAERLTRDCLAEVRTAVGLLRDDGRSDGRSDGPSDGRAVAPLPGIDGVDDLIDGIRSAGAVVHLSRQGPTEAVPATTGLAVYRILQEALTNAVRHAPGAPITVGLGVDATAVRLVVDSAGAPGGGTGLGLLSMRERCQSVGGCCEAGPGGTGWVVRAELPVRADHRTGTAT